MKKLFLSLGLFAFVAVNSVQAMEYGFDKAHSYIGFTVKHILSKVPGEFKDYDGTFTFDPKKPEASQISVTIQAASISTDNDMRDHHLQSKDFFEVETYPTIIFTSTKVTKGDGEN